MNHITFIQRIADHIQSHYNLNSQELTVVFPNKRAAFYLRNAFKESCSQTVWLPQMLSIEEAVTQWSGMTLADNIDLLFELIDIDAQLSKEQNSDLSVFGSQAAQMAKDFDEIDQYGIDAKHVFNYVLENKRLEYWNFDETKSKEKEIKYLHFFHSLYDYYLLLRERLSAKGKGYYGAITRYLAELPETELMEKIGDNHIIFAGFNALTTTEECIINTLIRNKKAEILFDYDSYYLEDENNEAGLFARRYQKNHPEWLKNGISKRLQQEEKHIHIIKASGNTLQTKSLQAVLQKMGNDEQAVVLADERILMPVLNAIPDDEAYRDIKVSMGYPTEKSPVNQVIKAYFALRRHNKISRTIHEENKVRIAEGWPLWPILHFLDLEIVKIIIPQKELALFNIRKNEAVKKGKFILEMKDLEEMDQAPNIQAFLRISLSENDEKSPQAVLQIVNHLLAFIATQILSDKGNDNSLFLLNQVSEIGKTINRLNQIIERNSNYVKDLQSLEILYHLLSSSTSVKLNSSSIEGLQIMGLLETRNLDFTNLHLLSVNEGILPADKSQGSFIPYYIRKECGLPNYAQKQAIFAYHFYHLLQSGTNIYLYYNNLDETSGGEASRFILQVKHELAKNGNIHLNEETFNARTEPTLETSALTAQKQNVIERIQQTIKEKGLSPSSLSTYLNCPLNYYLKYIVHIEDDSVDEEIGANIIGTIIHDTLEYLFEAYKPTDGRKQIIDKILFDTAIMPQWEQMLNRSIGKNMPKGFSDIGFNYLNIVNIKQQLKSYLRYTSEALENNTLTILETEGELETYLPTEHGNCRFYGRTDRIDIFGGITRVIDYKTGHVETANVKVPVRHIADSNLDYLRMIPEKALQLLLYKYLYLKQNPNMGPEEVTAAIHGLKYVKGIEFNLSKAQPKSKDNEADSDFLNDNRFVSDMEALLEAVISEIFDLEKPFVQLEDAKKCNYCDFKLICKR